MANRAFNRREAIESAVVDIFAKVTFGAAGAPTLDPIKSKGIKSITRSGAGVFVLTLQDRYPLTLFLNARSVGLVAPAAPVVVMSVDGASVTPPTVGVMFYNNAGAPTDPASGEEWRFQITLKNTTAP